MLRRGARALWRLRFTISMLAALRLAAWLTGTHFGTLSVSMLRRIGFAPRDLWQLEAWRALTSALVTEGGATFFLAMLAVAAFVGTAEWLRGSQRAALTFWGVHLTTILIESLLIALPLHLSGNAFGSALATARDVGPSAGYFGCLGLAIVSLPLRKSVRLAVLGAVFGALVLAFIVPIASVAEEVRELSADIAHVIALPLGAASALIAQREPHKPT